MEGKPFAVAFFMSRQRVLKYYSKKNVDGGKRMKQKRNLLTPVLFCLGMLMLAVGITPSLTVQAVAALNEPMDPADPVHFYGDTVEYAGKTITLDASNIYIDGSLSDEICQKYDHVYNDFKKAYNAGAMKDGTETAPMNVWLAPYVYWIDDPDDEAIREGINGDPVPYGLWMNCNYLSLNGLTDKPENVVLAVNRGQSHGARGNFTMFYINGTGTHTENLTMGNYCCVDLDYPLKPELNREKRTNTITQSQLCLTNGKKITADNCHFISRLNSCPFVGGERILFTDCHFECTDDSLPTSAIFLHCDFDFYSSRPFYNTSGTGSVMMDCDFHIKHNSNQYLTKFDGVVTIIDSTFYSANKNQYIGWTPDPSTSLRCYAGNITVQYDYEEEGETKHEVIKNYTMDADKPYVNVDITDSEAMDAYRLTYDGKTIYNVYNLFKGTDQYDPLNQKEVLESAGAAANTNYTDVPVALSCNYSNVSITNGDTRTLKASLKGFSASTSGKSKITWSVEDGLKDYITLQEKEDGSCDVTCKNETVNVVKGMIYARDASGLVGGTYVTAAPKTQPAPVFTTDPVLDFSERGTVSLVYRLTNSELLDDISSISWYRCSDAEGKNRILVAVTQNDTPLKSYTLGYGDVGYYMQAVITPKQQCTYAGTAVTVVSSQVIKKEDVTANPFVLETDFSDFAYTAQARVIPGFWIRDAKGFPDRTAWTYEEGVVGYGSEGFRGLMPMQFRAIDTDGKSKDIRRSRLLYVPPAGSYGDMEITWVLNPEKNAGQGFGSAGQYMDLFIKMDAATMTGYALRVERVSQTARGVQAAFVRYNGWDQVEYISDKVLTSAFNSTCTVRIAAKGSTLTAKMTTTHSQSIEQANEGLLHEVELEAQAEASRYGGLGIYYTGSCPAGNRVMFNQLNVLWDGEGAVLTDPVAEDLATPSSPDPGPSDPSPTPDTPSADPTPDVPGTAPTPDIPGQTDPKEDKDKTEEPVPAKGKTFIVKNIKYKITKKAVGGRGLVSVCGVKKKSIKSVKIAGTVSYKGASYTIREIAPKAFAGCKKLKKITITGKKLIKVGKKAFKGIHKKCVIKVPASKAKSYKKLMKGKGQAKTVRIRK